MCSDVFVFVKDEMTDDFLCNQRALQHLLQKTKTLPDHPFKLVSLWLLGNIRCTRAKFSSLHKSPAVTTCMWQSLMATGSCCLCQNTRLQPFLIFRKRRVSRCGREKKLSKNNTWHRSDQVFFLSCLRILQPVLILQPVGAQNKNTQGARPATGHPHSVLNNVTSPTTVYKTTGKVLLTL